MQTRLSYLWDTVRGSFWFLPAVLTAAAVGLSFGTVAIDRMTESEPLFGWTYRGGPDGARGVLGTIAGSMITVAGVVFSITVVALSLASQQFGPRLIRNFTRDRGNQLVLGTFVATFVYCLLVLRTVNGTEKATFVPELGVTVGVGLALTNLGVLIYFIHHVAQSIQASTLIERIGTELGDTIDELYPEDIGRGTGEVDPVGEPSSAARAVRARKAGYILGVDADTVMRIAMEHDLVVYLLVPPGRFIHQGDVLAQIDRRNGQLPDGVESAVQNAVMIGSNRTGYQDVEFALLQLTEIAVRALSPGINDPFTTIECINRLGQAYGQLVARKIPLPERAGPDGQVRVIAHQLNFTELLGGGLDPIRFYARGTPLVLCRLLDALSAVGASDDPDGRPGGGPRPNRPNTPGS